MLTYAKETIRHKAEAHTLGMERFMGWYQKKESKLFGFTVEVKSLLPLLLPDELFTVAGKNKKPRHGVNEAGARQTPKHAQISPQ